MNCPRCGTQNRSKVVCPTCGHRSRRRLTLFFIPFALALIAFVAFIGNAYFKDMLESGESLADRVNLNVEEETASADGASPADLDALQNSLYQVGNGTGFLISSEDVLTAASNVSGLTDIVMKKDGAAVNGTVVGRTGQIAVIRIKRIDEPPFLFTQAIADEQESLLTMTVKERINGTVTFDGKAYERAFQIPRHAIGSPLLTETGRVLAIHLRGIALPVASFEEDVRQFLESDTPMPPSAELAPVEPITPKPKKKSDDMVIPVPETEAPPVTESPTEEPTDRTPPETEEPVTEPPATEPTVPAEPEEPPAPPEEVEEPAPPVEAPAEPEPPIEEPAPPVEEPVEPEPPVEEPIEPIVPETPVEEEQPTSLERNDTSDEPALPETETAPEDETSTRLD